MRATRSSWLVVCLGAFLSTSSQAALVTGTVFDTDSGKALPARVYVWDENGQNHFVQSSSPDGSALPYREQWVPMAESKEQHTTISAHPFQVDLKSGQYTLEVHRGKEYTPFRAPLVVGDDPISIKIPLRRWIDLSSRGWYSGETHVHRRHFELPNVMLAEDLNIAFPVTFWTTSAHESPHLRPSTLRRPVSPFGNREDRGQETIVVDQNHLIVPRNTEYEIFSIGEKRHTLGAVFVINHKTVFTEGMPPVKKIAELAHAEGALLDLDKHSWPWSLMLPPVAKIDLFELSNNSVWQTRFGFSQAGQPADYMQIELKNGHMSERGWLDYGFHCYYALLNCGLRMTPTAGTASGVHPVPLGFSRVYVHLENPFTTENWIAGLKAGNSFVTTGPMLFATVNGQLPSSITKDAIQGTQEVKIEGHVHSANRITQIELIMNGDFVERISPINHVAEDGSYQTTFRVDRKVDHSSWIIARCFTELPNGRERFAHTAPFYIDIPGKPIRPKQVEIDFLTRRMKEEIQRNQTVLSKEALSEFEEALEFYQGQEARQID
jgi:hypothetical protein